MAADKGHVQANLMVQVRFRACGRAYYIYYGLLDDFFYEILYEASY